MRHRYVSILFWILSVLLTLFLAVYQRMTGPTYPIRGHETVNGRTVTYQLLRTHTAHQALPIRLEAPDSSISATLSFKRFKTQDAWTEVPMTREGNRLIGSIPGQPMAGKVEYQVRLSIDGERFLLHHGEPVIARFKGNVPLPFLILHILLMFFSILMGVRTGLETLRTNGNYSWMVTATLLITGVGGMILGPIVQWYAFGDAWTGFPMGTDLTDNKILIAMILWIAAFFLKKKSKWWVFAAVVVMVIVYLVPHSVMGSELDYATGKMRNKYSVLKAEQKNSFSLEFKLHLST
ncbi:MAG: hypothetical protein ACM3SY_21880 [Candidatus Omnitrophota bacterium]